MDDFCPGAPPATLAYSILQRVSRLRAAALLLALERASGVAVQSGRRDRSAGVVRTALDHWCVLRQTSCFMYSVSIVESRNGAYSLIGHHR